CIRHAASVHPEPGSNSQFKVCDSLFLLANRLRKMFIALITQIRDPAHLLIETLFSFQRSTVDR
ncbi:hypothetical protein, partial [Ligilactobacillus animalis]|uniref:hypothetical protein n=1 Tax=Ligilactobacillus animalis TaxID=1605 RepID=UPI00351330CA